MGNAVKSGAVIFAKDVAAVARFYEAVVPMAVLAREAGAVRLENEAMQLVIHDIPKAIAKQIEITVPPRLREQAAIKPVFAVDSLERVRGMVSQHGGGMNPASKAFIWSGFRACDGHDPEGNQVQFREAVD